jgi:hypothetical protein
VAGTSFRSFATKKISKISKSLLILRRGLQITNTCSIVNHFLDCHNADHSTLKFMLIDQRDDNLMGVKT